MPELPDVETFKKRVEGKIERKRIKRVMIRDKGMISRPSPKNFARILKGNVIKSITRRGKFLIFPLKSGHSLIMHFGMTGDLKYSPKAEPLIKYDRVIFFFNGYTLRYISLRRLGMVCIVPDKEFNQIGTLATMGPEPLEKDFTYQVFLDQIKRRKEKIKPLLLDQRFIAGIGNICADEILFQAKMHPEKKVADFTEKNKKLLYQKIKKTMKHIVDNYEWLNRSKSYLMPGRAEGLPCPRCRTPLRHMVIAQRSAYYCPHCQPRHRRG